MTCIVGIVEKDRVYIGGDSAGVSDSDVTIRKDVKVFKVGDFVFGCTSSFRMMQIIRFSFKPPKIQSKDDVFEYMCTKFITALRDTLKSKGFFDGESSKESGGTFLVGYKNRLFKVMDDFQVGESAVSFEACGYAENYAKGVLYALSCSLSPETRIKRALEAAVYFSGSVRSPFVIENT